MSRPGSGNATPQGRAGGARQQGPRHSNAGNASSSPRTSNAGHTPASNTSPASDAADAALIKELKGLVSQPVKLTLSDGRMEAGLLWSFDVGMGIAAIEVPKSAVASLGQQNTGYPATAAAFPTATLSSIKVAAQGGDASGARTTFHMFKLRKIKRVERLTAGSGVAPAAVQALSAAKTTPVRRDINVAAAEARERAATAEALKRSSKIGVGVSKLGQDVFDALNKTLPCRWADRHIIVMDEFVVSPDGYDTATVPNVPTSTLKALAEGKEVSGAPEDARSQATRWQRVTKVLEGERKKLLTADASVNIDAATG